MLQSRKDLVHFILVGFFIANAILAELVGGKVFVLGGLSFGWIELPEIILSVGVILWPIVFLTTDILNEYFGKDAVKRLTWFTAGLILYCFAMLYIIQSVPSWKNSPISADVFAKVFSQSMWIIAGSLIAFLLSQLIDIMTFLFLKKITQGTHLWLRATGSTVVSQLVDTFCVGFIGFVLPGSLDIDQYLRVSLGNYFYKFIIAVSVTPLIYVIHFILDRYMLDTKDLT